MPDLLLIGAGFSRNWGGWLAAEAFEYLLGAPEVLANENLRTRLWKAQPKGGFEVALADLQRLAATGDADASKDARELTAALASMFADMNDGLLAAPFEFGVAAGKSIARFLARFDAIFSLNQDLLIEHHYLSQDISLLAPGKFAGAEMPGVLPSLPPGTNGITSWARRSYRPKSDNFFLGRGVQPFVKLHGSSNWFESDGSSMLVMGANKVGTIGRSPILSWYGRLFDELLGLPDARLMIIGYGFRDEHINLSLTNAVRRGLKFFVVAPEGADLMHSVNSTAGAAVYNPGPTDELFERGLIGASRRPMRDIFGSDGVEFSKVMRFFER